MGILEKLYPPAKSILTALHRDVVSACSGWLTCKNIKTSDHFTTLKSVHTELESLKQETWKIVSVEKECEHLNTRLFQAEMGICHKFQLLQTILSNEKSSDSICDEVGKLRKGILDVNTGVLSNLSVINKVLVGKTVTNPAEDGLLEMWSKGVYNDNVKNQMHAKAIIDYVLKYWTKAAVLQFKGLLLFTGANSNSDFCLDQYDLLMENLEYQNNLMENTMPTCLKYLAEPNENNIFVLRPFLGETFEPFVRRNVKTKKLVNEYFCGYNEEGKWIFEKSEKDNGSLLISSSCKSNYLKVSNNNKAEFVSEKENADSFYVIPLDFNNERMKIIICQTNPNRSRFLGNSLNLTNIEDNITFTLTKYNSSTLI